jgi:hypothetical protein
MVSVCRTISQYTFKEANIFIQNQLITKGIQHVMAVVFYAKKAFSSKLLLWQKQKVVITQCTNLYSLTLFPPFLYLLPNISVHQLSFAIKYNCKSLK